MTACAELELALNDVDIDILAVGRLHEFVAEVQVGLGAIHDASGHTWFESARAEVVR